MHPVSTPFIDFPRCRLRQGRVDQALCFGDLAAETRCRNNPRNVLRLLRAGRPLVALQAVERCQIEQAHDQRDQRYGQEVDQQVGRYFQRAEFHGGCC